MFVIVIVPFECFIILGPRFTTRLISVTPFFHTNLSEMVVTEMLTSEAAPRGLIDFITIFLIH
jgi:hypothetical protein